jgi:pimeloyl-ACP methyl ester carboxylesterase
MLSRAFAQKLQNGPNAWWGANAVMNYQLAERLPQVASPALVLRPMDHLWEATQRARGLLREARFADLPEYGHGLFEVAPEAIWKKAAEFFG